MTALDITAADLAGALTDCVGKRKLVADEDTGEIVGWIREEKPGGWWQWHAACDATRSVRTREQAVQRIGEAIADDRRRQEYIDRELAGLPKPLQALRLTIEDAKWRHEVERQRNVRRPADYARTERELRQAELAYAAAERALAEAA